MRVVVRFLPIVLGPAIAIAGCAAPPTGNVDEAKAAVEKAASERANQYAPESFKAAQDAQAALDAELKAQESKWFKSYDRARELATAARTAGEKATADATAAREGAEARAAKAKAAAAPREKAKATAVRVGGKISPPVKIKDVTPVYPAIAKSARVSGVVTIEATIDTDGKVVDTKVVRSVPLLDQAALEAVQHWEYKPSLLNGKPVPVVVTINVNFRPS